MYCVPLALQCVYGCSYEKSENGPLYADDIVLCCELEEDLGMMMMSRFVELCKKRDLKVNADTSKVMVIGREEGLECEVHVDGT